MKLQKAYNFAAPKFNETCKIIINSDNLHDKICFTKIFVKKSTFKKQKTLLVKILSLINL